MFADKTTNLHEMPPGQCKTLNEQQHYKDVLQGRQRSQRRHQQRSQKTLQRTEFKGQDGMLRSEARIYYLKRPQRKHNLLP